MSYNAMPYIPSVGNGEANPVDTVRLSILDGLLKGDTYGKAFASGTIGSIYARDAVDYLTRAAIPSFKSDNKKVNSLDDIKFMPYTSKDVAMSLSDRTLQGTKDYALPILDKSLYQIKPANSAYSPAGCGYRC